MPFYSNILLYLQILFTLQRNTMIYLNLINIRVKEGCSCKKSDASDCDTHDVVDHEVLRFIVFSTDPIFDLVSADLLNHCQHLQGVNHLMHLFTWVFNYIELGGHNFWSEEVLRCFDVGRVLEGEVFGGDFAPRLDHLLHQTGFELEKPKLLCRHFSTIVSLCVENIKILWSLTCLTSSATFFMMRCWHLFSITFGRLKKMLPRPVELMWCLIRFAFGQMNILPLCLSSVRHLSSSMCESSSPFWPLLLMPKISFGAVISRLKSLTSTGMGKYSNISISSWSTNGMWTMMEIFPSLNASCETGILKIVFWPSWSNQRSTALAFPSNVGTAC